MREIKFRAYDSVLGMREVAEIDFTNGTVFVYTGKHGPVYELSIENSPLLQYTGLKDKNGIIDIYEGDIISSEGKVMGNVYKGSVKKTTDLLIEGMGTSTWRTTEQEALARGLKYTE